MQGLEPVVRRKRSTRMDRGWGEEFDDQSLKDNTAAGAAASTFRDIASAPF